jgi:putative NADPH-quinone reductase
VTRALVLFAHPCPESFSAALHREVVDTLEGRGWQVDDCDLNAEGFSPVLTVDERRGYHDTAANIGPVREYVERLRAAEALVMVFPVWNFGYPAILKGFLDRVLTPGFAFRHVTHDRWDQLLSGRTVDLMTTMDTPPLWYRWVIGRPGHNQMRKSVLGFCGVKPVKVSQFGPVKHSAPAKREKWLGKARAMGHRA